MVPESPEAPPPPAAELPDAPPPPAPDVAALVVVELLLPPPQAASVSAVTAASAVMVTARVLLIDIPPSGTAAVLGRSTSNGQHHPDAPAALRSVRFSDSTSGLRAEMFHQAN